MANEDCPSCNDHTFPRAMHLKPGEVADMNNLLASVETRAFNPDEYYAPTEGGLIFEDEVGARSVGEGTFAPRSAAEEQGLVNAPTRPFVKDLDERSLAPPRRQARPHSDGATYMHEDTAVGGHSDIPPPTRFLIYEDLAVEGNSVGGRGMQAATSRLTRLQAGTGTQTEVEEEYLPHHSEDYADKLGKEDGVWPPYPIGPSILKDLACGSMVTYEEKLSFSYTRLVKEKMVDVIALSGNWMAPPALGTAAVPGGGIGRPPEEVKKIKEKYEAASDEASGMYLDMMHFREFPALEEFYKTKLSKRAIDAYLDDLTRDTKCEPGCEKIIQLEEWYALLTPKFDTRVEFRLASPQPVDLGPDRYLWEVFAQVVVRVEVTIHCIFTVKCVEHSF